MILLILNTLALNLVQKKYVKMTGYLYKKRPRRAADVPPLSPSPPWGGSGWGFGLNCAAHHIPPRRSSSSTPSWFLRHRGRSSVRGSSPGRS